MLIAKAKRTDKRIFVKADAVAIIQGGKMSHMISSMRAGLEASLAQKETDNERVVSLCKMAFGGGLLLLHGLMRFWAYQGMQVHPGVLGSDIFLLLYGGGLWLYLRHWEYRWWRKYAIITVDVLLIMLMFWIMRITMQTIVVTYIVLYPAFVVVALCGLRYSPGLVLYCGGLVLLCFTAYTLAMEGVIPFLIGGWLFIIAFTFISWYVCRSMPAITVDALRKARLQRFFSPDVVKDITRGGDDELPGGKAMQVTVLFSDIRDFTTLSEVTRPSDLVALLNEYFSEMVEALFSHRGMLDKFIGDAVMAVFGAPEATDAHAADAVAAGLDMLARLEGFNKELGTTLLLSEDTAAALPNDLALREVGDMTAKGRRKLVKVFTPV